MLQIEHLTLTHTKDLRVLISDLSLSLSGQDRLAVIGEEGDGKSTLLKVLFEYPDCPDFCQMEGKITHPGERMGYLSQEEDLPGNLSVYAYCMTYPAFAQASWEELATACAKTGLSDDLPYREALASTLSGGEKVRLRLTLLLLSSPTLLLLDEPSNDLDLEALEALEHFLLSCHLPVLFVSHDETLLSRCATGVLHLESVYGKQTSRHTLAWIPYDDYVHDRLNHLRKQEQLYQSQQKEKRARDERFRKIEQAVAHAQESISRQDPHSGRLLKKKMKAVKSLEHRFEREDQNMVDRPNIEWSMDASWGEGISLPQGKIILDLDLPELRAGDRLLASPLRLHIRGPEKLLIVGKNGSGKTTLMRLLSDTFSHREDVHCVYFPQHYEELFPDHATPVTFLHTDGSKDQLTAIRTHLGALRFTREEMDHPISSLSGGQKAKLLLLRAILEKADVLLMDEPTRNLSPLSAPVLRDMLLHFPGCVICVTHDRLLIAAHSGRILRLTENGLVPWNP